MKLSFTITVLFSFFCVICGKENIFIRNANLRDVSLPHLNPRRNDARKPAFVGVSNTLDLYTASVAGAVSQSLTWSMILPLEIVKTRIQTASQEVTTSLMREAKVLMASSKGHRILRDGLLANGMLAFSNGIVRYGLFDRFKDGIAKECKDRDINPDGKLKVPLLFTASSAAEILTCCVLAPLDKLKVFVMAQRNPLGVRASFQTMIAKSGILGLWQSLIPTIMKQIPYTAVRLSCYEMMYGPTRKIVSEKISTTEQQKTLYSALLAGLASGIAGTIVSHPADVLNSKISSGILQGGGLRGMFHSLYAGGLQSSFAGLGPRLLQNAILTASQMILYESIKEIITSSKQFVIPIERETHSHIQVHKRKLMLVK